MGPKEIYERLVAEGIEGIVEFVDGPADPSIVVEPASVENLLEFLRDDEELMLDQLSLLSGLHFEDRFECVYHLLSTIRRHDVVIRVRLSAENPSVPTVSGIHPTAGWHERETYDLMGIVFDGHPDLRRIYLPQDWNGHPLRRDYEMPEEYDGMPLRDINRLGKEPAEEAKEEAKGAE